MIKNEKSKYENTKINSLNEEKVLENSIDNNQLSESLKNILSDKEFASAIEIKKENIYMGKILVL